MTVAIAALHFLLAFILVACLVAELVLLKALPEHTPFPALAKIDALYGLSAGLLVAVGLYRAINFEKGWAYYSHSLPFLIKLGLLRRSQSHPSTRQSTSFVRDMATSALTGRPLIASAGSFTLNWCWWRH